MSIFHKAVCKTPGCNIWLTSPLKKKKSPSKAVANCPKCGGELVVSTKFTIQWYKMKNSGKTTKTFETEIEARTVLAKIELEKKLQKLYPELNIDPPAQHLSDRADVRRDNQTDGSTPFDEIAVEFHRLHSTEIKDIKREKTIVDHLIQFYGNKPIGGIFKKDLMAYRTHRETQTVLAGKTEVTKNGTLFKRVKKPRKIAASTVGRELSVMRQIINFAWENKYVYYGQPMDHPFYEYGLPGSREVDHIISEEDRMKLFSFFSPATKPFFEFVYESGCRITEAMTLTWKRVEGMKKIAKLKDTKTSKADGDVETLFLSPMAWAIINAQPKVCEYVFYNPFSGTRWKSLGSAFRKAARKAGLIFDDGDLRPHDLRHNLLTEVAETEVSDSTLMVISRHKDVRSLQRYVHRRKGKAADKAFELLVESRRQNIDENLVSKK
ncbi:tyrosine-type recombinase/integrase [Geopsychrobacter electrodiphilus]|uniref:tyrosine-type recombinase/integrase n=1 Tax=Geopsychrobacter electrodiphilus TaxID=225196 RepID=UPI0003766584|nr:integrase [Geopsychrobacter electrodiphilus]